MKWPARDRLALVLMCVFAAYQVSVGTEGYAAIPTAAYTVGFGVLLVAGLLLIILGREVLDAAAVVILSTIIPLSISVGLVWQFMEQARVPHAVFATLGLLAVVLTRSVPTAERLQVLTLAIVHGVAGTIIFLLPLAMSAGGRAGPGFAIVGIGGALMGAGGLLLAFARLGKPILPRSTVLPALPGLLLITTALFVAGFRFGLP